MNLKDNNGHTALMFSNHLKNREIIRILARATKHVNPESKDFPSSDSYLAGYSSMGQLHADEKQIRKEYLLRMGLVHTESLRKIHFSM